MASTIQRNDFIRLLITILCFATLSTFGQTSKTVQIVSASASVSTTADVVICTGANVNLTLPASPTAGRVIQVINHGTGDLLFSAMIWVSNTDSFDFLPAYPNEFRPKISTNTITIIWDSVNSKWRLLN